MIQVGVWDIYQEPAPKARTRLWASAAFPLHALPYVARMLRDIANIKECQFLLLAFLAIELVIALVPACSLYYSGKLLTIVQTAVEHRTVDTRVLVQVALASLLCSIASSVLPNVMRSIASPLHLAIKRHYSVHIFYAMARLDLPTFDDTAVQRQLEGAVPNNSPVAFDAVTASLGILTTVLRVFSQLSVLVSVLRHQQDGPLLATLVFAHAIFPRTTRRPFHGQGIWTATTTDTDYIRSEGLKRTVANPAHRKEIVASGIGPYLLAEYRAAC